MIDRTSDHRDRQQRPTATTPGERGRGTRRGRSGSASMGLSAAPLVGGYFLKVGIFSLPSIIVMANSHFSIDLRSPILRIIEAEYSARFEPCQSFRFYRQRAELSLVHNSQIHSTGDGRGSERRRNELPCMTDWLMMVSDSAFCTG